jgi:uncharacterized protein
MNLDDGNPLPPDPASSGELGFSEPARAPHEFAAPVGPFIPEDLRTPWGWPDLLLLVAVGLIWTVVASVILVIGFAAMGVNPALLKKSPSQMSFFLVLNSSMVSLGLFAYLIAQMRVGFRAPFWKTIGWRPLEIDGMPRGAAYFGLIFGGFLFSVLIQLTSAISHTKTKLPIEAFFQDRRSALLLIVMAVTIAPLVEETIFRGYIYPVLARSFGVGTSVIITGTLFGLLHAQQLWGGWTQIGLMIVVGIVFTYARAVTRTVVASYLLHVSYNTFPLLAFLVASHGLRNIPLAH